MLLMNVDVKWKSFFSTTSKRPYLGAGVGLVLNPTQLSNKKKKILPTANTLAVKLFYFFSHAITSKFIFFKARYVI